MNFQHTTHAGLFDLDGVITDTARVHAAAWKKLFDEYLRAILPGGQRPFDIESDYLDYVDGKTRYHGVESFLKSRGISIPWGNPSDDPSAPTVCGLGNKKDAAFVSELTSQGVHVFDSSRRLILDFRANNIPVGVVSSSRNCLKILEVSGLIDLFQVRVDGDMSSRFGIQGKPAPDMFLRASEQLRVSPSSTVVFEDSLSGVQAAARGEYGCIVGIDRSGQRNLAAAGAHRVVKDLDEISLADIDQCLTLKKNPNI